MKNQIISYRGIEHFSTHGLWKIHWIKIIVVAFFSSVEVGTQVLAHAKQALYY